MACDSFLIISLSQVVNRLIVASSLSKLVIYVGVLQVGLKTGKKSVNLEITGCIQPAFNKFVNTLEQLAAKLTTCNTSVAFLSVSSVQDRHV